MERRSDGFRRTVGRRKCQGDVHEYTEYCYSLRVNGNGSGYSPCSSLSLIHGISGGVASAHYET